MPITQKNKNKRNECSGTNLVTRTWIQEECSPNSAALQVLNISLECSLYFNLGGFEVYAETVACIEDCVDISGLYDKNYCENVWGTPGPEPTGDGVKSYDLLSVFIIATIFTLK